MAVAEANAIALGVPIDQLMENAGRAVAEEIQKPGPGRAGRVVVIAGPGNNGGDGTAAAHYLHQWGYEVSVQLLLPPTEIRTAPARQCYERIAERLPVAVGVPEPRGASRLGRRRRCIARLGSARAAALSLSRGRGVDPRERSAGPFGGHPDGLHDPEGIRPRWTIALTALKEGMVAENSGAITVREIGIPRAAIVGTGPGDLLYYPTPARRGRRGRPGASSSSAGGPYSGAPALAGLAALRVGAERATIFAPAPASDRVQAFSPNLVVRTFGEERFRPRDVRPLREALYESAPKAVLIGMGAGRHPRRSRRCVCSSRRSRERFPWWSTRTASTRSRSTSFVTAATTSSPRPTPGSTSRVFGGDPEASEEARLESVRQIASARGSRSSRKGRRTSSRTAVRSP